MILDIARHKLYEAFLTLAIIALATVVGTISTPDTVAMTDAMSAPMGRFIGEFEVAHPILSTILGFLFIVYLSFIATRSTVRSHLYGVNSFAAMTLTPLMIMGLAPQGAMLSTILLSWLVVEALRRLFFAFGSEERQHAIFSAMLAVGAMPLLDSFMFVALLATPLILVSLRCGLREMVICIVGALLPIFTYAYVTWCGGGGFASALAEPYHNMMAPSMLSVEEYFTLPRVVLMGTMLLAMLLSMVMYFRNRLALTLVARHIWGFAISTLIILAVALVVLPSPSAASFVCPAILMSMFAPMFFLRMNTLIAVALYILMISSAVAVMGIS